MEKIIRIAAALLLDAEGRALVVRKRGTAVFMQPGGKIEPGETPLAALLRELDEELGLEMRPEDAVPLGLHAAPAANEPGHRVEAVVYRLPYGGGARPGAEIAEIALVDPADPGVPLAELSRLHILPLAQSAAVQAGSKSSATPLMQ